MNITYRLWTVRISLLWLTVSILACGLFYGLGMWQIQRYQDKQAWLEAQSDLTIEGVFLPDFLIYIDNKIMDNIPGYEILQAFQLKDSSFTPNIVLISRGWVAQAKDIHNHYIRSHLPEVITPNSNTIQPVHLQARQIKIIPSKYGHSYLESNKNQDKLTIRVSRLDIPEIQNNLIAQSLNLSLIADYYFSISKNSAYQLTALPEVKAWLNPHKHLGYAVQWFAFCLLAFFLYIRFGLQLIKTPTEKSSKLQAGKI